MKKFLVKRIGYMIVTLVIIITATFYMMHSIPGDPLAHMARNLPEQTKANYYAKYGLDKSTTEQYGIFMKNLITKGDLGESLKYPGTYITDTLLENSKVSATPGGLALIVGVFLGIILGIVAALHKNKWPDYIVMFIAILGITVPVFVLASLLQFVFCVQLGVLPTTGWGSWQNVVLPTVVLSFGTIATYARYVKSNMLDVMNQDYILTAEAKRCQQIQCDPQTCYEKCISPMYDTSRRPDIRNLYRFFRCRKNIWNTRTWILLHQFN